MKKSVYINLAGKNYPLNFSLGACKIIVKELGSLENFEKTLTDKFNEETIDKIETILQALIAQGCAYKNLFEIDAGIFTDKIENPALNKDGRFEPVTKEMLELAIGFDDIEGISDKIRECISVSSETEIEGKKVKNEKAPEEKA